MERKLNLFEKFWNHGALDGNGGLDACEKTPLDQEHMFN